MMRLGHKGEGGGEILIEGAHLCRAYLEQVGSPLQCVFSESALNDPELARLVAAVPDAAHLVLDGALFRALSQLEQGVGLAFVIPIPMPQAPGPLHGPAVLIDRLQDPGNLGSILRSSAAAGIPAIYCAKGTVSVWSQKVLRAAMGAHFQLRISEDCDLDVLVGEAQVPVMATSSRAKESIYDVALDGDVAWLFGNEGQGIGASLFERARCVGIPQPGGMESLNAAAAAAICLFEGVRQRTQGMARMRRSE